MMSENKWENYNEFCLTVSVDGGSRAL